MRVLGNRTLLVGGLSALVTALVLGAVVLFVRGDDNAPIQVLLPAQVQNTPVLSDGRAALQDNPLSGTGAALKVYVSGAVRNPGVYTLQQDDRLQDAVDAAGGFTSEAATESVNLAQRVRDEAHYHILRPGETPTSSSAAIPKDTAGPTDSCGGLIDLNAASIEILETLPGIGPVRAAAIINSREQQGPFESVEEVTRVSGIGPATYEKISDLVTVCDQS